jgi:predicted Zn-dependent peptidase
MHEIEGLGREDALAFYRRFYTPENAILVVAGDVVADEVHRLADDTYGRIPARGEAPVGIVYATDARAEPAVKVLSVFPADTHAPIVYPMALAARAPSSDASGPLGSADSAARFAAFLRSPAAASLLSARGFIAPVP